MSTITKQSRPLEYVPFSKSKVDIIIPFHGLYEKVTTLIESIMVAVKSNPYHITLIDDCSENAVFYKEINDQFKKKTPEGVVPQVSCIRNEKQIGFGASLKVGYDSTSLPWVLFMHSDCVVEDPNFMIEMGQSLLRWKENNQPVKIVSARSNNPMDCSLAKGKLGEKENKDIILEKETLPLFCAMCHRDLFNHIGGFIKPYPYAWYEEDELAYRMRRHGYKQGISMKSWIRHEGSATIKQLWTKNKQAKEIMEKNHSICLRDIKQTS
jgi:GT2 family glycosyltransferase